MAQGRYLYKPLAIDVFESSMFWVAGDDSVGGKLLKQDKFGRGVATIVADQLEPFNLITEVLSAWRVEFNKKPATIYLPFFRIFYIFLLEYIFN